MSVITGNITSKCSFNSHVGSVSDEQDFDADFCIILLISSGGAWVKDDREALVDSSICSEVESAGSGAHASDFWRMEILLWKYSLNLLADSLICMVLYLPPPSPREIGVGDDVKLY